MSPLRESTQEARTALVELYRRLRLAGCAAPTEVQGQLIRPVLALAGARGLDLPQTTSFWSAAAALQLAHEASLVHDDVIDEATTRRSRPTVVAARGVAAALVEGDHLLTTAYRLAAATSSPAFTSAFAHAVERTVAGEKLQGRSRGLVLDEPSYREVVSQKSGELLGCSLAAAALVADDPRAPALYALGRRIGTLYQMLDDLLDYCPDADTGKPPLADYRQRRWTWPLLELEDAGFDTDADDVLARFVTVEANGSSPLRRCLLRLEREADMTRAALALQLPGDDIIDGLILDWLGRAAEAVQRTERATEQRRRTRNADRRTDELRVLLAERVPAESDLPAFFRHNSRSFSFAARLFPAEVRRSIQGVYAFCRITDDLADDDALPIPDRLERLDAWRSLARRAWEDRSSGIPLLDDVLGAAAAAGVPFRYVEELIEGMRMDLRGTHYATHTELRLYSYRVAGVVGQWVTRLCGVHDPDTLESAAALGHAMQLTNILRDVGEDLEMGRVYLPDDALRSVGLDHDALRAFAAGAPIDRRYADLMEKQMRRADEDYARALEAARSLPAFFRRPVVVAAHVYRGIQDGIRANGYDNFSHRARTTLHTKLRLAVRALRAEPLARQPTPRRVARVAGTALGLALLFGPTALHAQTSGTAAAERSVRQHDRVTAILESRPDSAALRLDLVRTLFMLGVEDAQRVAQGQKQLERIRATAPRFYVAREALMTAYAGAFRALEAKHGIWPPSRLRAVRDGLELLDRAVTAAPHDVEVRYLRAVNTHYLPGIFGRGDTARDDVGALARMIGDAPPIPPEVRAAVIGFLVDADAITRIEAERLLGRDTTAYASEAP